uniref:Putative secreted protein n=1 Tax=Anopheles darlingi TaxID=43151 RepID=A0A2M4D812_ANODA
MLSQPCRIDKRLAALWAGIWSISGMAALVDHQLSFANESRLTIATLMGTFQCMLGHLMTPSIRSIRVPSIATLRSAFVRFLARVNPFVNEELFVRFEHLRTNFTLVRCLAMFEPNVAFEIFKSRK